MTDKNIFQLEYDDQLEEVVEKISKVLNNFGLKIVLCDRDTEIDGYQQYEIIKIENDQ